jgi:hypothetical protein
VVMAAEIAPVVTHVLVRHPAPHVGVVLPTGRGKVTNISAYQVTCGFPLFQAKTSSTSLSLRMIDFHGPAVEVTDACAYRFAAISASREHIEWIYFRK